MQKKWKTLYLGRNEAFAELRKKCLLSSRRWCASARSRSSFKTIGSYLDSRDSLFRRLRNILTRAKLNSILIQMWLTRLIGTLYQSIWKKNESASRTKFRELKTHHRSWSAYVGARVSVPWRHVASSFSYSSFSTGSLHPALFLAPATDFFFTLVWHVTVWS